MLRHLVLFQIKDEFKAEIPVLAERMRGMVGQVDGLISLEAGGDILHSARSCDFAISCLFRDRAAFDAYQTHPAHLPIRARMHEVRSASYACDFEV